MATTATPYGLIPIRRIGSGYNSTGTTPYKIASGYGTGIFYGDLVRVHTDGTLVKETAVGTNAAPASPVGVFLGCQYTDATMGFVCRQYWPASTVAADAVALVCDDPNTVFKIQASAAGTRAEIVGGNVGVVQGTGSTTTGKSAVTADVTTHAVTATVLLRVIGFDTNPSNSESDTYADLHVMINTHQYAGATTAINGA